MVHVFFFNCQVENRYNLIIKNILSTVHDRVSIRRAIKFGVLIENVIMFYSL